MSVTVTGALAPQLAAVQASAARDRMGTTVGEAIGVYGSCSLASGH